MYQEIAKIWHCRSKNRMRTIHRFLLFPQKIVEKWGCVLYTGAYYLRVYTVVQLQPYALL